MSDSTFLGVPDAARRPPPTDAAVRTQLALLRALFDELARCAAGDAATWSLLEQVEEEMRRLARLVS